MKRLIEKLLGIHIHSWTDWVGPLKVGSNVFTERYCEICGAYERRFTYRRID